MGDSRNQDKALPVVDGVDDSVVADADSVVVLAGEFRCARGSWFIGQSVDGRADPSPERIMKPPIRSSRLAMKTDLVWPGAQPSSARISDQGMEVSRSSRAWRAAKLSSR